MRRLATLVLSTCFIACGGDDPDTERGPSCADGSILVDGACALPCPCDAPLVCHEDVCVGDGDADGVIDPLDECRDSRRGFEVDDEGCSWNDVALPFNEGPYGTGIRDVAGPFTVETVDGTLDFREAWTGTENWFFLVVGEGATLTESLLTQDLSTLLAESAQNVHYVFLVLDEGAAQRARRLKADFVAATSGLDAADRAYWSSHLHFVTEKADEIGGELGNFLRADTGIPLLFAIDRQQRWREVGSLADSNQGWAQTLRFLAKEATYFDYERRLALQVESLDARVVSIFDGTRHEGGWEEGMKTRVEVELPSSEELKAFDSMAFRIFTACPGHRQGKAAGCNEWDYAHHLMLCDKDDATRCDTELVRYVTPYAREGEWFTDVSGLLPLLQDGGKRTFEYRGANAYDLHLELLLWDAGRPDRPVAARYLFGKAASEEPFDKDYDSLHAPLQIEADLAAHSRAELWAVITGHGFDATADACAEFCNHTHHFTINGTEFVESHEVAGMPYGCYDQVKDGTVPNQFGTWPYGRAGWCAGMDVKPFSVDVTAALVSGENTIGYTAKVDGQSYDPAITNPKGYHPNLRVASWLVFWAPKE